MKQILKKNMQVGKCYLQQQYTTAYEHALPSEFPLLHRWVAIEMLKVTDIRNKFIYCNSVNESEPIHSFIPIEETRNFRYMELDESEITLYLLKVL